MTQMGQIRMRSLVKRERGFTLVELLVALAIVAVIGSAITMTISQVFSVSIADKNRMEAVKQVENALHYINRDAQMASSISPSGSDFPLVLSWDEWNLASNDLTGPHHQVTYSIIPNSHELKRAEIIDSNPTATMTVANYILDTSDCSVTGNPPQLTVHLTASVGGYKPGNETRTLEVRSRPELMLTP